MMELIQSFKSCIANHLPATPKQKALAVVGIVGVLALAYFMLLPKQGLGRGESIVFKCFVNRRSPCTWKSTPEVYDQINKAHVSGLQKIGTGFRNLQAPMLPSIGSGFRHLGMFKKST